MENLLRYIYALLGIQSSRTKNISNHVLLSLLYKGGHLIATFLLVPLTISYLDNENYGIWLTLSSFIAWFTFFDIGLGNGLRNKFAEARALGEDELARGYVSTAYFSIGIISLLFLGLSMVCNYIVDWSAVFNASEDLGGPLSLLMPIVLGCFSLQLILKLITSIYIGDQNHSLQGKIGFITSASSLFIVWLLIQFAQSSLLLFGSIFSLLPVLVLLVLNIIAFSGKYRHLSPKLRFFKMAHFKDIFGLGLSFFIIQVAVIVMFSTDNFIITQLFSPEEVVPYNIAYKYIGIPNMLLVIILTPYWSSITEAYTKGELNWIKGSMKNLMKFALWAVLLIGILVIISPFAYDIWVGEMVSVPFTLTLYMAIYFVITVCYAPYNFFHNGIGKIRLQMYAMGFGALINVPLSIVLVKYTALQTEGVILATIISVLPMLILMPLQYYQLINRKATGIFNQ